MTGPVNQSAVSRIALKSIMHKEIHRFMRIWVQTLVPPAITISLYFVIFGELIGSRIGQMGGFDYITFNIEHVNISFFV